MSLVGSLDEVSALSTTAEVMEILGGLTLVIAAFGVGLRRFRGLATWLSVQPVRSGARSTEASWFDRPSKLTRDLRASLHKALGDCQKGVEMTTAEFTWAALGYPAEADFSPYSANPKLSELASIIQRSLDPRRRSAALLYLIPDLWADNVVRLRACEAYLAQFQDLRIAKRQELKAADFHAEGDDHLFADFASTFTGATVLVDATQVQGRCADALRVWHRPEWEGMGPHCEAEAQEGMASAYDARHRPGSLSVEASMENRKVGQYDGSVPTLAEVALIERPGRAGTLFGLTTRETCYVDTEPTANGKNEAACKKLVTASQDRSQSLFVETDPNLLRWQRRDCNINGPAARTLLLNVVLGVVCRSQRPAESLGALVFARRSTEVRNAAGGLGPSAGGVIELSSDSDQFGAIDPLRGVLRETHEELGLLLNPQQVKPHAVYLATGRNKPVVDPKELPKRGQLATGQLVATVLYLARCNDDIAQLQARRHEANPVEGAFETEGLVKVELGMCPRAFVKNLQVPVKLPGMDEAEPIIGQLEQSSLLVALYASAWLHIREGKLGPVIKAWTEGFDAPWWDKPLSSTIQGSTARLCRMPGRWLGQDDAKTAEDIYYYWPKLSADAARQKVDELRKRIDSDHACWETLAGV